MEWLGFRDKASIYSTRADRYAETVRRLCFNPEKGIYADDPQQTFYDQRASILAVLAGAHNAEEQKALMERIFDENIQYGIFANSQVILSERAE